MPHVDVTRGSRRARTTIPIAYTLSIVASLSLLASTILALAHVRRRARAGEPYADGFVALVALAPTVFGVLFARLLRQAPEPTSGVSYYAYLDEAREAAVRAAPAVVGRTISTLVAAAIVGAVLVSSLRRTSPLRCVSALASGFAIGLAPTTLAMGDQTPSIAALLLLLVLSLLVASSLLTLGTDLPHARLAVHSATVALLCGTGAEFMLPLISRAFYRSDTLQPLAHGHNTLLVVALVLTAIELGYARLRRGAKRPDAMDFGVVVVLAWLVHVLRPFAAFTFYAPS